MTKNFSDNFGIPRAKSLIPDNDSIITEALKRVRKHFSKKYVEENFFQALKQVMDEGYKIYLEGEEKAKKQTIVLVNQLCKKEKSLNKDEVLFFSGINFENSATQMRKARAGGAFEIYVEKLLDILEIPSEKTSGKLAKILNRTDRVVPSVKIASKQPDLAKFLSMKTSLAERWKQVVPEQNKGWAVYLLTLDEKLTVEKAKEIDASGIVLFVRDPIKEKKGIDNLNNIRKLSDFPSHLSQYKLK